MTYDQACEQFSGDVDWLVGRWLNIKIAFECDANCTLSGDVDLERAYRRICELQEKIEDIRIARLEECLNEP